MSKLNFIQAYFHHFGNQVFRMDITMKRDVLNVEWFFLKGNKTFNITVTGVDGLSLPPVDFIRKWMPEVMEHMPLGTQILLKDKDGHILYGDDIEAYPVRGVETFQYFIKDGSGEVIMSGEFDGVREDIDEAFVTKILDENPGKEIQITDENGFHVIRYIRAQYHKYTDGK